jgi:hypothetical protein
LTVSNTTVSDNAGYGIWNGSGTATVSNSTISNNGGYGFRNNQTLNFTNTTIAGNALGGIEDLAFGTDANVLLLNCTVANNGGNQLIAKSAYGTPVATATIQLRNTIAASNGQHVNLATGPAGGFISQGHNLCSDSGSDFLTAPDDWTNTDPMLGPLQDNGGPTKTMALLSSSPALNAGDPDQLGVADQRGVGRSGGVNIGAYQASASALVLTVPPTATAGVAFDLTVKAIDAFMQTAFGYTGTVNFSSTDGQAALPDDYVFTGSDAGQHTFSNGVTLQTAGSQAVTATDTTTSSITGSDTVTVNPAAADHLLFLQQPTDTNAGQTISPVMVLVVDQFGNVLTTDNSDTVTLSIGNNPSGGTLSGTLTVTVVNGVAIFSDLAIDLAEMGYTLHATIGGALPDIDSNPFNIT